MRLDISSSDFPNFDRNHNTGADYWSDAVFRPARQTVYSDAQHPAYLTLPVCAAADRALMPGSAPRRHLPFGGRP